MDTQADTTTKMKICRLARPNLYDQKFRTQFFELLDTDELDEEKALSMFHWRRGYYFVTFIGLDENNMPIATASIILEPKFIRGGAWYGHIADVKVHKNYQGKGLGTEIMKHVMDYAEQNCNRVVLECEPHLEAFYQTHGFKTIGIAMKKVNAPRTPKNAENEDSSKETIKEDKTSTDKVPGTETTVAKYKKELQQTERQLIAANKLSAALSKYHLRYIRGMNTGNDYEDLMKKQREYNQLHEVPPPTTVW